MNDFKQTDIGPIPVDWDKKKIKECYSFTKKTSDIIFAPGSQIPFIPMELIPINRIYVTQYILKSINDFSNGTFFQNDDILLSKITPSFENGKQAIANIPFRYGYASTEIIPIHEISEVSSKLFLFYYLLKSDIRKMLAGKMEGSTGRQRLPKNLLENTFIPFPPLPEQRKIAFILSQIQKAIENQEQIIKTTQELKKALMQKLFIEGINNEPQKHTEIGLIPKSWEVITINDCVEKTITRNPLQMPDKFIKYVDVSSVSNQSFSVIDHQYVMGKDAPGRARKVIKTNDVIFATIRPTLKRIAKINEPFNDEYCSTAFCVLRCKSGIYHSEFLFQYLQTDYFIDRIGKLQSGASYPAVRDENVKEMIIPFPDYDEQEEISGILFSLDSKIEFQTNKKIELQDLFKTMLNQLMSGQLRVKDINLEVGKVPS
jgi:type I restriction enzyme, S subunit